MATLINSGFSVGSPYTVETLDRLAKENELSAALLIPRGQFELKPFLSVEVPQIIKDIRDLVGSLEEDNPEYISPYDLFTIDVTAIPSFLYEKILDMNITGPFACFLEDPLPEITDIGSTTRSFETALRIGVSPWWAPNPSLSNLGPGPFFEPYITCEELNDANPPILIPDVSWSPEGGTGRGYTTFTKSISGYYTERNWTDREWVLKHRDVYARYNINGRFTMPGNKVKMPLYRENIKDFGVSGITPFTFFSQNMLTAGCIEEIMLPYLRCAEQIVQWKASEIKKMRFYYLCVIDSVLYLPYFPPFTSNPPPILLKTPIICHMTVDSQNDILAVLKLLCANELIGHGNCDPEVYEDLNQVPDRSQGGDDLESECFRINEDFNAGISTLTSTFGNVIGDVIGDSSYEYDPDSTPFISDDSSYEPEPL